MLAVPPPSVTKGSRGGEVKGVLLLAVTLKVRVLVMLSWALMLLRQWLDRLEWLV